MTTETITRVLCDHPDHQTEGLETIEAETTVELELGGRRVLLDLCAVHRGRLLAVLEPWLDSGAPVERTKVARGVGRRRHAQRRPLEEARVIRAWALERGLRISERGRIPEEVVRLWNEAQG